MNRFGKPPERIRREKKLILLISEKNPLFGEIAALERIVGYSFAAVRKAEACEQAKREGELLKGLGDLSLRHEVLGISAETLRKWSRWIIAEGADDKKPIQAVYDGLVAMGNFIRAAQHAGTARPALGGRLIDVHDAAQSLDKLKVLLDRLATFRLDYDEESQKTAVYSTAKQLGIAIADAQCVIDTAVYSESPLLVQPYRDRREAEKDFGSVAGIYKVLLHRHVHDVDAWLQGALHVRYVLATDNRYVLRVKLNFPMLYPGMAARKLAKPGQKGPQPWEYDGFVDVRGKLNWVLEKRDDYRPDYFYFITSPRSAHLLDNKLRAIGQYLTSHQDDGQTVVAGPVMLEYVGSTISPVPGPGPRHTEDETTDFMWKTPDQFMLNDEDKTKRDEYGRLDELAKHLGLRPA